MSRIGVDIDGCLADFNTAYIKLMMKHTEIVFPPCSDTYPDCWSYDKAAGMTSAQLNLVWADITKSKTFWLDLAPLPGASDFLRWISNTHHDIYFVTSRPGDTSKWQTERWLKRWGFFGAPTVLISSEKGLVCDALRLNYYADDKVENCADAVNASALRTTVYMVAQPWNFDVTHTRRGPLSGFQRMIEDGEA